MVTDDESDDESDGESLEDGSLEEDFPLGDGTAETDATIMCPHCGESVSIALDPGSGDAQEYVEDCEVCCRPWTVRVNYFRGDAEVSVMPLDQ